MPYGLVSCNCGPTSLKEIVVHVSLAVDGLRSRSEQARKIEGPITIACVIGRPWIESFTALGEHMMDSTLTS